MRAGLMLLDGREKYGVDTRDQVIARHLWMYGHFEHQKFESVLRILGRSQVGMLVDVGANIGTTCVPALARQQAVSCIAIEPDPVNARLLRCNLALNDLDDRARVVQAAVGMVDGEDILLRDDRNFGDHRMAGSSRVPSLGTRVTVEVLALDGLCASVDPSTDLIWMDIQGFEIDALFGARGLLAAAVPLVMEFWPYEIEQRGGLRGVEALLRNYKGFVRLDDPKERLQPISALEELTSVEFGLMGYTDLLLVPATNRIA